MPKNPSLLFVVQKEIFSFTSFAFFAVFAFVYILLVVFLLNYRLVIFTLFEPVSIGYKVTTFFSLFLGIFTAFSPLDTFLFLLTALLVGINLLLIFKTIFYLRRLGKMHLSIGGAALLGVVATGCSSCGFSFLSVIGVGASFGFLPFHGLELHVLSICLLLSSGWYMLKKLHEAVYCRR